MLVGRTGLTLVLCSGRNLYWIIRVLFKLVLKFFFGWSSFYPDNWAPLVSWITFQGFCSPRGLSAVAAWKWNGPHLMPALRSGKPSAKQEVHSDLFVDFWKFLPAYLPTSLVLCHENSCHPFRLQSFSQLNKSVCSNTRKLACRNVTSWRDGWKVRVLCPLAEDGGLIPSTYKG